MFNTHSHWNRKSTVLTRARNSSSSKVGAVEESRCVQLSICSFTSLIQKNLSIFLLQESSSAYAEHLNFEFRSKQVGEWVVYKKAKFAFFHTLFFHAHLTWELEVGALGSECVRLWTQSVQMIGESVKSSVGRKWSKLKKVFRNFLFSVSSSEICNSKQFEFFEAKFSRDKTI